MPSAAAGTIRVAFTSDILKALQSRWTARRVWLVGLSMSLDKGFELRVMAPEAQFQPLVLRPAVPFHVRLVPEEKTGQPARFIRICGVWMPCAITVLDALSKIYGWSATKDALATIESLAPGDEPGGCVEPSGEWPHALAPSGLIPSVESSERPATIEKPARKSACGCGADVCPHGRCAESCEGFQCAECGTGRERDK